jgi:cyclophilin family peptidyl-prolyl cis-trans isomerase
LYHDVAPRHVENFVWLARDGFYDGLVWHRYVAGFVIQGGDPKGTGEGGPGYTVPAEFSDKQHVLGAVAAARLGDEVNPKMESSGSQFYICLADVHQLDNKYTVFGQVVRGMDVVDKLRQTDYMEKIVIVNVNDIAANEPEAPAEPTEEIVIGE